MFIGSIERKGVPFREFIAARSRARQYPHYQVAIGEKIQFLYTEDELIDVQKRK